MSEINVLDKSGKKVSTLKVEPAAEKVHPQVVMDAVVAYRAAQRSGTANTKTRAEVAFTGKKPWKQKGTGRARVGDRGTPIWRKGGIVFGPRPRSYRKIVPRGVRRAALRAALDQKAEGKGLILVESLTVEKPKTKELAAQLQRWKVDTNVLLVSPAQDRNLFLAARNLEGVELRRVRDVTTYEVIRAGRLVTTPEGWKGLVQRSGERSKS